MLRVFNFYLIFELYCILYEFSLFPCRIITLLTTPLEKKHSRKHAWRCIEPNLDSLNIFVEQFVLFEQRHFFLAKFFEFLFLPMFVFLFAAECHLPDKDSLNFFSTTIKLNKFFVLTTFKVNFKKSFSIVSFLFSFCHGVIQSHS